MTREEIRQSVRGFLKALLTLPDAQVLVAESAGTVAAGSDAFLTVDVVSSATVDHQSVAVAASGGGMARRMSTQRRVRISINAYGYQAEDWMQTIQAAWYSLHSAMSAVRTAGLTPGETGEPRSLRVTGDVYPSPRYQMDLTGYHRVILADDPVDSVTDFSVTDRMGGLTSTYTVEA
jgi:hypothetical protein